MLSDPAFLAIGHVTRDLLPDGSFSPGGTVTFAALTASHLGLTSAVVSRADPLLLHQLSTLLPNIQLQIRPSELSTTFSNQYQDGFRTQYLHARSEPLALSDIPPSWLSAAVILLGPLAQELSPSFVAQFPRRPGSLLAATPQGWLRRWDATGRVWPTPWQEAEQLLPLLDVLILSHDDLLPFAHDDRAEADAILARWSRLLPLLVATDGRHGATLYHHALPQHFPAFPAQEVDPTGAGDVFAAAFLTHLYRYADPASAVAFANCTAAFSIEQPGIAGIPSLEQIMLRLSSHTS